MNTFQKRVRVSIYALLFLILSCIAVAFTGNEAKKVKAETATVSFAGVVEGQNYDAWVGSPAFLSTFLTFSGPTFSEGQFTSSGTPIVEGIYYDGPAYSGRKHFDFVWIEASRQSAGLNTIELLNSASNPIAEGSVLHVVEGTSIGGQILPEITLRLMGNKWVEYREPTVSFTGVDTTWNNIDYPFSASYGSTILRFSKTLFDGVDVTNPANTLGVGYNDIAWSMQIDGTIAYTKGVTISKNFYSVWGATTGGLEFYLSRENYTTGSILTIAEGTYFADEVLPQVTLQFDGTKWVEVKQEVSSTTWFASAYGDSGQYGIGLTVPYTLTTQQFCNFYGFSINGNALGSGILWGTNQILPLFDMASQMQNGVNGYEYPTIEIKDGAKAVGVSDGLTVYFKPKTLFYVNNSWTDVNPNLTLSFTGFSSSYNHGIYPWGNGAYNAEVLEFDKPLYSEKLNTANMAIEYPALASGIKINGVAIGTLLAPNVTFNTLSTNGALEFYYDKTKFPVFSKALTQIVLTIDEGTEFLGNILPAVTVYFNGTNWQTEEYTYIPTAEATLSEINASYNNAQNPWREDYYLSAFAFDKVLSVAGVLDSSATELGNALKLNGTSVNSLGWLLSAPANGTGMNVQSPKTSIPSFSKDLTQIKLQLSEAVIFGDVEIQPFTLYLNGNGQWQTEACTLQELTFSIVSWNQSTVFNNSHYFNVVEYNKAFAGVGTTVLNTVIDHIKVNGVNGTSLELVMTEFEGQLGFQIPFAKMPEFSSSVKQIVLTIDECIAGNCMLPALTFYLNGNGQWQTTPYIYGLSTVKGASIRITDDINKSGIRFETHIDFEVYNSLLETYCEKDINNNYVDTIVTGTYIIPKNYLDKYDGNIYSYLSEKEENRDFVNIINDGFYNRKTAENDGYYRFFGSLVGLLPQNYTREFIGVGYIVIDGVTYLGTDGSWSRSIYDVAKAYYKDTTEPEARRRIVANQYIDRIVEINGADLLEPVAEYTVLNEVLAYSPVNYGLVYNSNNGVFTITAVGDIYAVIVDGVNLGAITAGETKYLAYYDGKILYDNDPSAIVSLQYGFGEPTQELWGTAGSSNWNADSGKTASMWASSQVNTFSTAENIATIDSAFGGNTARIWMHTDELSEPTEKTDANYLKPGALAVVKEVIADYRSKGVTNIAFQTGLVTPMYAKTFYNSTEDAWYSIWEIVGGGKDGVPYKGIATLPNDDGSVSGMSYAEFLDIQEEYFYQLLLEIGDTVTCLEILNEIELARLIFRQGVEAKELKDLSRLDSLTVDVVSQVVMDVCFRATKAVKRVGKDVKILMPSLACVDGNAIDKEKSVGLGFNTVTLFNTEYNYIKNNGLINNGSNNPDDYFQLINMHPYVLLSSDTSTTNYLYNNSTRQTAEQIANRWITYVNSLRQIAANNGDGDKTIWITEFGMADYKQGGISGQKWSDYNNNTVTRQTEVFTTIITMIKNMPCFDSFIFFRLGDYSISNPDFASGGEATYGILDKNGTLKQIGKNLYTILTGSSDYSEVESAVAGIKG